MSGGGSDKKSNKKKDEPVTAIPGTGAMMTQQPFMPGMDQALAQQLAAGYGGDPSAYLAQLMQTYAPMQILDTRPGATPAPTTPTPTPTTPSPTTPSWQNGGDRTPGKYLYGTPSAGSKR